MKSAARSARPATAPASCAAPRRSRSTFPPASTPESACAWPARAGPGSNGGPPGDVNLIVTVRPDRRFERDGDNLRTDVDVPVTTAVLGGEVEVRDPDRNGGADDSRRKRKAAGASACAGRGCPSCAGREGERGDLLARARIVTPTNLTDRERELYEELRALRPEGRPDGAARALRDLRVP